MRGNARGWNVFVQIFRLSGLCFRASGLGYSFQCLGRRMCQVFSHHLSAVLVVHSAYAFCLFKVQMVHRLHACTSFRTIQGSESMASGLV